MRQLSGARAQGSFRGRRGRWLVALVALAVVAAGCTRSSSDVEAGSGSTTTPGATAAPVTTAASGTDTTAPAAAAPGDFGSLKAVCGPGDAKGATAQGVTDDTIDVGTISDPGFVGRPGLNQEMFDASEVFVKWCNDAGGINGRKLKDTERDAKLTEYKQRITEACQQDFALVGGGGVFDDTGQDERLKCLLPDFPAYQVTPKARGSELAVPAQPSSLDKTNDGVFQYLKAKYPDSIAKAGFLTGNVAATVITDQQVQEAVKTIGYKVVYQAQYNAVGEASWTPFAEALRSKGAKGLVYTGEPENADKLLQAIDDIGYKLDWVVVGANHLDAKFIQLGGSAVHGVYMFSLSVPYFEADKNPATQQYLDLFAKYKPTGKAKALLATNSWTAWLLFAESAKACGSDLTRKCLFEKGQATKDWTGGGLHAPTQPGALATPDCGIVVLASPDGFSVPSDFTPNEGLFKCDPSSVVTLKGDYGKGATLADVGKSLSDLK